MALHHQTKEKPANKYTCLWPYAALQGHGAPDFNYCLLPLSYQSPKVVMFNYNCTLPMATIGSHNYVIYLYIHIHNIMIHILFLLYVGYK